MRRRTVRSSMDLKMNLFFSLSLFLDDNDDSDDGDGIDDDDNRLLNYISNGLKTMKMLDVVGARISNPTHSYLSLFGLAF